MPWLTDAPIERDAVVAEALRRSDGAVVVFDGVVRDHNEGKAVESIVYEAYREMAEKEIDAVVRSVEAEHPDVRVALRHRLGLLAVGDSSIVIACASPHRADAFEACRKVIDRLKKQVPIWKKERGPGGEEWVGWQQ